MYTVLRNVGGLRFPAHWGHCQEPNTYQTLFYLPVIRNTWTANHPKALEATRVRLTVHHLVMDSNVAASVGTLTLRLDNPGVQMLLSLWCFKSIRCAMVTAVLSLGTHELPAVH